VWILFGDGACGWGLAEFDSFVRQGIAVIAIVGNDAGWTQIAREQVKMLHDDVATVLARTDYHRGGRGFGAEGLLVSRPTRCPGPAARARAGRAGAAGAGQRVAGPHRVPRGLAVDVSAHRARRRCQDRARARCAADWGRFAPNGAPA
jgi:hypothetical protein